MKHNRVIATTVLFLLLGVTLPAFAQKDKGNNGNGRGNDKQSHHEGQPQRQHQSQPQHQQQAQQQHHQQQHRQQQSVDYRNNNNGNHGNGNNGYHGNGNNGYHGNGNNGNHYGRISDNHYRTHFGNGHSFHMGRPEYVGGYNRFHYGGYYFGYNQAWPVGWGYDDDVYVEYMDGGYYMINPRHPGLHLTLNIF